MMIVKVMRRDDDGEAAKQQGAGQRGRQMQIPASGRLIQSLIQVEHKRAV
jgi:hypothetical protein